VPSNINLGCKVSGEKNTNLSLNQKVNTDVHTIILLRKGELKITQNTDVHPSSISVKFNLLQCLQG
jgi:hypothetical protein